jgi:large subunit ribosomal protein L22
VKTNERAGTRAVLRHSRLSAYKVRQVLDLIRGQDVSLAGEILANGDREAATVVGKVLASAVANAAHNDGLDSEDLFVSACYADEGSTLKRWRPRARGRATRIRKRTSHITIIVSRMPDERIARRRAKQSAAGGQRSRRVAGSRRSRATESVPTTPDTTAEETSETTDSEAIDAEATETTGAEDSTGDVETDEDDDEATETDEVEDEVTDGDTADDESGDTAEEKGK